MYPIYLDLPIQHCPHCGTSYVVKDSKQTEIPKEVVAQYVSPADKFMYGVCASVFCRFVGRAQACIQIVKSRQKTVTFYRIVREYASSFLMRERAR